MWWKAWKCGIFVVTLGRGGRVMSSAESVGLKGMEALGAKINENKFGRFRDSPYLYYVIKNERYERCNDFKRWFLQI